MKARVKAEVEAPGGLILHMLEPTAALQEIFTESRTNAQ
jgi:hypothetical protein